MTVVAPLHAAISVTPNVTNSETSHPRRGMFTKREKLPRAMVSWEVRQIGEEYNSRQ